MKGYYLRIKKTAKYKAMQDEKREHNFLKSKRERLTIDFEEKIKKHHNRMRARNREYMLARLEYRLCRHIRGERDYSKGLKNGN